MATIARKELSKSLRAAFLEGGSKTFDEYEPSEELLDAVDVYATSSDIVQNTSERDNVKLRETILHDCFEEGILRREQDKEKDSFTLQARSALIIILDKFASLDSDIVSSKEIREVWWNRLLKRAFLPPDPNTDTSKIQLGRTAAKAAKDLITKALCVEADNPESDAWRVELFSLYVATANDSFAKKILQNVLLSFGKSHPRIFYSIIDALLSSSPVPLLMLLNNFIRLHPVNAYQALQTPLFGNILLLLEAMDYVTVEAGSVRDLAWVSSSLTFLSMLLPLIPTSLDRFLDQLFLIFARCLLWHNALSNLPNSTADPNNGGDIDDKPPDNGSARVVMTTAFPPLLDYFTTLYGLFPANLLYFLACSIKWIQHYTQRQRKRRRTLTASSGVTGVSDKLLPPLDILETLARTSGGETSTSYENPSPLPGESATDTAARVAAAMRKRAKSRPHGKGRRSKIQKQKKDAAIRARKEKDALKQKEREKRRKNMGLASGAGTEITVVMAGLASHRSISSSESEAPEAQTRIQYSGDGGVKQGEKHYNSSSDISEEDKMHGDMEEEEVPSSDSSAEREAMDEVFNVQIDDSITRIDWSFMRQLTEPYVLQHILVPGALNTLEAEFGRNKVRFKKLESSDLIDEITRTRIVSASVLSQNTPSLPGQSTPSNNASMTQSQVFSPLSENLEKVLILQNQLLFEVYQKEQLVQRLGALLREHVGAGGAEADRQNLYQTVQLLRKQLSTAQSTLTHVRQEAATSRDLLNKYSSSKQKRLEILREEKKAWTTEGSQLRAELEDAQSSVMILNDKLAEAEKKAFELENEENYRKESESNREKDLVMEVEELKKELAKCKADI